MKYKAVIFDLFGTLIKNFPLLESNDNLRRMASELSIPSDDFISRWHATYNDRMTGALKDYQDCIRHICQQLGSQWRNDSVELAAGLRFEMNKREVMSPRDGAIEVLSALKANGYKTGLISNCSTETAIVWKNSSLAPLIDVVVLSCLVGLQKPDPRIYQIAMEKLDVRPKECMYIADGLGQELFTALKLRIRAVLIRVPGEDDYEPYREKWDGAVITSLKDVLVLVK